MSYDNPQRSSPDCFNELNSVGLHVRDAPVEGEKMRAERMADIESDGVKAWSPKWASAPKAPGVGEGIAHAEQR